MSFQHSRQQQSWTTETCR